MSYAIRLDNLSVGWGAKLILKNLSGEFERGSLTAIIGPNGAGKTTLVKSLVSMLKAKSGRIIIAPDLKNELSLLPQTSNLDRQFPITAYDLVAMGAWHRVGWWKSYSRKEHQLVLNALQTVGLYEQANELVMILSGGQLQRALFARLIVRDAQVMILDEPFAAIDEQTKHDLMRLIKQWHAQGRTVLVVVHDIGLVQKEFEQVLLLGKDKAVWGKTEDVLNEDYLQACKQYAFRTF